MGLIVAKTPAKEKGAAGKIGKKLKFGVKSGEMPALMGLVGRLKRPQKRKSSKKTVICFIWGFIGIIYIYARRKAGAGGTPANIYNNIQYNFYCAR
jgi:hypothetical protein